MSERDVETIRRLVGRWSDAANIAASLEDAELIAEVHELIAVDAPIEFATPEGGFMGAMAGPFRGPQGFLAGWREWVAPWSELRAEVERTHDLGDGRVLIEVKLLGKLDPASAPIVQPGAGLFELRDDRVVRIEHFLDREQGRRAAGLG